MRARSSRLLALGLAVAFAGESLLGLAHRVVEQHVRCPEHGDVIHVEGADHAIVRDARHETQPEDGSARRGRSALEAEHDHCFALASARERLAQAGPGERAPVDLPEAAPPRTSADRRLHARPIYRVAPKNSPPV